MNKSFFIVLLLIIVTGVKAQNSIYDFKIPSVTGDTIDFNSFRGKKILIVNTASESDQASQLAALEQLYQQYKGSGLVVVALPSNDFSNEMRSDAQLSTTYRTNLQLTFPIAKKVSVAGSDIAPLYSWLTKKSKNDFLNSEVKGDFQKYLINSQGKLVSVFSSDIKPLSRFVVGAIKQAN